MTTQTAAQMTARERKIMSSLCFWKDTRTTYTAAQLAESVKTTIPAALGALQALRRAGRVNYYSGDPGLWEATAEGRAEVGR